MRRLLYRAGLGSKCRATGLFRRFRPARWAISPQTALNFVPTCRYDTQGRGASIDWLEQKEARSPILSTPFAVPPHPFAPQRPRDTDTDTRSHVPFRKTQIGDPGFRYARMHLAAVSGIRISRSSTNRASLNWADFPRSDCPRRAPNKTVKKLPLASVFYPLCAAVTRNI